MIPSPEVIFDEFISLSDTSASYTGASNLPLKVNAGETGVEFAQIDHGDAITAGSLADDDHLQYLLLAGRSGGQVAIGGIAASDDLILQSTSHASKGRIILDSDLQINKSLPQFTLYDTTEAAIVSRLSYNPTGGVTQFQALAYKPGGVGNALNFRNSSNYISAGDVTELNSASAFTFSGHIYRNTSSYDGLLNKYVNLNNRISWFFHNDNKLYIFINNGSNTFGVSNVLTTVGDFHHVAVVFDGSLTGNANRLKMYLDGVPLSLTFTGTIPAMTPDLSGADLEIGALVYSSIYNFDGLIDELNIWEAAKTDNDILDLSGNLYVDKDNSFPGGGGSMGTNLVAVWHHDESALNSAPGGLDTEDSSNNSYHGTATGMIDSDFVEGYILVGGTDIMLSVVKTTDSARSLVAGEILFGQNGLNTPGMGWDAYDYYWNIAGSQVMALSNEKTLTINNGLSTSQAAIFIEAVMQSVPIIESQDSLGVTQNYWSPGGGGVINDAGNDVDWRVGAVGQPNSLFVRGSDGHVGTGTNTPIRQWSVLGGANSVVAVLESNYPEVFLQFKNTTNSNGYIEYAGTDLNFYANNLKWLAIDALGNIDGSRFKITSLGGYAIKLTNKTGSVSIAGQLVRADTATDDAVILTVATDPNCIGVFLDAGIVDGSEAWVVVSGIADVAHDDNVAATRGNWLGTGVAAGYARTQATPAASPSHFEELGHCIESVVAGGAGTHILARCVLHFN